MPCPHPHSVRMAQRLSAVRAQWKMSGSSLLKTLTKMAPWHIANWSLLCPGSFGNRWMTCVFGLHGAGVSTAISIGMARYSVSVSTRTGNEKELAVELDRRVFARIGRTSVGGLFSVYGTHRAARCTSVPRWWFLNATLIGGIKSCVIATDLSSDKDMCVIFPPTVQRLYPGKSCW